MKNTLIMALNFTDLMTSLNCPFFPQGGDTPLVTLKEQELGERV